MHQPCVQITKEQITDLSKVWAWDGNAIFKPTKKELDNILFMETQITMDFNKPFDGSDIIPELDQKRLSRKLLDIYNVMKDSVWRTPDELTDILKMKDKRVNASSTSANLRNLRKKRFGFHTVEKQRKGDQSSGLWEYKLIPNK